MPALLKKNNILRLRDLFAGLHSSFLGTRSERADQCILFLMPLLLYVFFFCIPLLKGIAGPVYVSYSLCYGIHLYLRREKKYLEKPRLYYVLLLIYLMSGALSLTYTPDFINGLKTLKTHSGLVFIPLLIETVSSHDRAKHYFFAYALGGGILALMGIYQGLVLHIDRPPTLWHATHGSHLLTFAAVASLALLLSEKKLIYRLIQLLLFFVLTFALYVNGSRGSWAALGAVLIVLPFVFRDMKIFYKVLYFTALSAVILLLFYSPYGHKKWGEAVNDIKLLNQSQSVTPEGTPTALGARVEMWKASLLIFSKNPAFGAGIGGWEKEVAVMMKRKEAPQFLNQFGETHNMYLDVLSTRGIVGLSAFMALIGYPIWYAWRKREKNHMLFRYMVIFAGIVFMIAGLTETVTEIRWSFLSYIGLTGVALAILARDEGIQQMQKTFGQSLGGNAK